MTFVQREASYDRWGIASHQSSSYVVFIDDRHPSRWGRGLQNVSEVRVLFVRKILESKSVSFAFVDLNRLALFVFAPQHKV